MKREQYINNFLIGADPEFVLMNPPSLVRASRHLITRGAMAEVPMWGYDHDGWVLEVHPKPSYSAATVLKNIRHGMNQLGRVFGDSHRWRAGAYLSAPERHLGLGGHVHIDLPAIPTGADRAMAIVHSWLEALDILPAQESNNRRMNTQYGRLGDYRFERGRFEYRSMCSWLFSQRVTMLCLTAMKLATAAPETIVDLGIDGASIPKLERWFSLFKGKDDDVDRIFAKNYFSKKLVHNPDRDLKNVWVVDPTNMEGSEPYQEPVAA